MQAAPVQVAEAQLEQLQHWQKHLDSGALPAPESRQGS